jgi:hypothetical protein
LHQVGDLFELNVKLRCQKVNHWLFTTEAWVEYQVNPLGFEVEKLTPGRFFFTSGFPCQYLFTSAPKLVE